MLHAPYGRMSSVIDHTGTKIGVVAGQEADAYFWHDDVHTTASEWTAHHAAMRCVGPQAQEAQIRFLGWQQEKRQIVQHMIMVCTGFPPWPLMCI